MDLLSDVLLSLKVEGAILAGLAFARPWGFDVDLGLPTATLIVAGSCWLSDRKGSRLQLGAGDAVLAPRGAAYVLAHDIAAVPQSLREAWQLHGLSRTAVGPLRLARGSAPVDTRAISMAYAFREAARHPVLACLPELLVIRAGSPGCAPWIAAAQEFVDAQDGSRPGYRATAINLAELIFNSLVQAHVHAHQDDIGGCLRGLAEPRIAKSLSAIHDRPGTRWTVASLAREAGMSRSAFAHSFSNLVGQSPIDYLRSWRIRLAPELIASGKPVHVVADLLGYRSERAFRQVFKQHLGVWPSRFAKGA